MSDTPRSTLRGASDLSGSAVGNYRITEQLSTGGMGEVYRARHELLGKQAAVKLLRPELTEHPEMVDRFFNEARAATAIRHPGIVEVFDFGYHADGRAYLVMEFLDGESLATRLAATRLNEVQAAVIARGIASALGAAHAKGIVHRDLKPDNVFLVPDPDMPSGERPKVLDFGIAKLIDADHRNVGRTRTGALMGTPAYMAPEQARAAGELDHRADLYSLGCMLYEMLTGAPPFLADGAGEIISLQLFAVAEPPSAKLAGISEEMDRLVMRLLEKDPADRYQRASEVVEALTAAIPTLSGRLSDVLPAPRGRRQAMVIATHTGANVPTPDGSNRAQPMRTPVPIGAGIPRRSRSLVPAIVAGAVTLGITTAVIAFIAVRNRAETPPPPPPPTPAPVVVVQPPAHIDTQPVTQVAPISYHLDITPPDATVLVDGAAVLLAKGFFSAAPRPDRRLVTVTAPGFDDATLTLAGDASEHREVVLVKATTGDRVGGRTTRRPGRPTPPTGSDDPLDRVQSATGTAPDTTAPDTTATTPPTAPKNPDVGKTTKIESGASVYTKIDDDPK